jgi:DNA-binding response OmpR family regulator
MKLLLVESNVHVLELVARTSASQDFFVDVAVDNQADEECFQAFDDRLFPVQCDPSRVKWH